MDHPPFSFAATVAVSHASINQKLTGSQGHLPLTIRGHYFKSKDVPMPALGRTVVKNETNGKSRPVTRQSNSRGDGRPSSRVSTRNAPKAKVMVMANPAAQSTRVAGGSSGSPPRNAGGAKFSNSSGSPQQQQERMRSGGRADKKAAGSFVAKSFVPPTAPIVHWAGRWEGPWSAPVEVSKDATGADLTLHSFTIGLQFKNTTHIDGHVLSAKLREIFDDIDIDNSGTVSKMELMTACQRDVHGIASLLGIKRATMAKIDAVFKMIDEDDDVGIEWPEFEKYLTPIISR